MRHTCVTETPTESGEYACHACPIEFAGTEETEIILADCHIGRFYAVADNSASDDGYEHKRDEHQHSLNKVRPANRVESAQKRIRDDNERGYNHCDFLVDAHNGRKNRSASLDGRSGVNAIRDDENYCANHAKKRIFLFEPVLEELRYGYRVVRNDRETTKAGRNEKPREDGSD